MLNVPNQIAEKPLLPELDKESLIELVNYSESKEVSANIEQAIQEAPPVQNNYFLGIFFMVLCTMGYTMMGFSSKLLYVVNPSITFWDQMLFKGIISTLFVYMQSRREKVSLVKFNKYGILLLSGAFIGFLSYVTQVVSYRYIPATKASLIIYANPVVVVILAYFFLKENVTRYDIFTLIMVIFGCYLVTNTSSTDEASPSDNPALGYFFAFLSCLTMGTWIAMLRVLNQHVHNLLFVFYMFLFNLIPAMYAVAFTNIIDFSQYGLAEISLLVATTLGGIIGQV